MSNPEFIPEQDSESPSPRPPKDTRSPSSNKRQKRRPKKASIGRQTAGILGIFLGFSGAHHYYLGSNGAGLALVATSCCGVGVVVGVVEGVMLLAMSDEEFEQKYVTRSPESFEFVFQERP